MVDPMSDANPFATPQAAIDLPDASRDSRERLASRWARLAAAIIDGAIALVFAFALAAAFTGKVPWRDDDYAEAMAQLSDLETLTMNALGIGFFLALHGYLLAKHGQTLGKLALGLRIVNQHGEIPKFLPLLGLRYLPQWIVVYVPRIGGLLTLIDLLFIFGKERRCLHDYIAGTWVIRIHGPNDPPQPLKALTAGN